VVLLSPLGFTKTQFPLSPLPFRGPEVGGLILY
jgi:hypothetical protein